MIRRWTGAAAGASVVLVALSTNAEEKLGSAGHLALSADRMFGIGLVKETDTRTDGTTKVETEEQTTMTTASLLTVGSVTSPGQIPRVAIDYFAIPGLSVGGAIGFASGSGTNKDTKTAPGTTAGPGRDIGQSFFIVAPRVGYALMLSDHVGIWPRAGITYWRIATESSSTDSSGGTPTNYTSERTFGGVDANVEAMLVITPVSHVAFNIGPVFDATLTSSGSSKATSTSPGGFSSKDDLKAKFMQVGLAASMMAYF